MLSGATVSGRLVPSVHARDANPADMVGRARTDVLWSAATARDIVAAIAQDAQAGRLLPAEAVDMIDRVWARAAPASPLPFPPAPRPGHRRRDRLRSLKSA